MDMIFFSVQPQPITCHSLSHTFFLQTGNDGAEYTPYTFDPQEYNNNNNQQGANQQYDNAYDYEDPYGAAELAGM